MGLVTIKAAIKSKLDAQVGVGKPLYEVHDEHKTGFGGYPAVTFEPSDQESDYETNTQNYRGYVFRIDIHQEMEQAGRAEAIDILCAATDTIVQDFEEDYDLGGIVEMCSAVPLEFGVYDEGAGKVMYTEILLTCKQLISINP